MKCPQRAHTTHARAILGQNLYAQLLLMTKARFRLLVGAGGIQVGCELCELFTSSFVPACPGTRDLCTTVKNIVLTGFGEITVLDLDTIDLSHLNRQFLFRKKDVKKSKALASSLLGPSRSAMH